MQDDENVADAPVEQPAETGDTASQVPEEQGTQPSEQPLEQPPQEEIEIEDYWNQRYPAIDQGSSPNMVQEVAQELSRLPTDESGTVETNAAAEWFASKLSQVSNQAQQDAARSAERAAMGVVNETAQQQQLLKKYPDITKDKETLDAVFDLRDAAAFRGQKLTLTQAAAKLDKLRQQGKSEGVQSAQRQTTIQAAAHLETASNKGSTARQQVDLSNKEDRRAMLTQYVQNEQKAGRIQTPN